MRRPLRPDELRVWVEVAKTVKPAPGMRLPEPPPAPPPPAAPTHKTRHVTVHAPAKPLTRVPARGPGMIEPGRHRRIARERDEIDARLDLHGYDQDRARLVLHAFLRRAWDDGARAVLVITGKGTFGEGVIRRRTPEWLAEPDVRPLIAGVSQAHRRHGGEGALYIALKRKR
jgi:DNA-nicking Smr family endonuclease